MGQLLGALVGMVVCPGIGPFAQRGLDEAFGLAVGFRGIGPCADVLQSETLAGLGEGLGAVAGAVVGLT